MADGSLGVTELWALSEDVLLRSGYVQARNIELDSGRGRLFEDRYGLVCVSVFPTWADLAGEWPDMFGELVELVSTRVPATDAKSWETYLVLLTPDLIPRGEESIAAAIRYDMRRVRKMVATGAEMQASHDVERFLRPLLPLEPPTPLSSEDASALDLLPELLAAPNLPAAAVSVVVDAFKDGRAVITALDQWQAQR